MIKKMKFLKINKSFNKNLIKNIREKIHYKIRKNLKMERIFDINKFKVFILLLKYIFFINLFNYW